MKNKTLLISSVTFLALMNQALAIKGNLSPQTVFKMFGQVWDYIIKGLEIPQVRFGVFFIFLWVLLYNTFMPLISRTSHLAPSAKILSNSLAGLGTISITYFALKRQGTIDSLLKFILIAVVIILIIRALSWINHSLVRVRSSGWEKKELRKESKEINDIANQEHKETNINKDIKEKEEEQKKAAKKEEEEIRHLLKDMSDEERVAFLLKKMIEQYRGNE